ncbi:MAG: ComEC family competence protein [Marinilabiliales bacterium]|nr:ComEC family competence protein [Marinilabiliales bacterium]
MEAEIHYRQIPLLRPLVALVIGILLARIKSVPPSAWIFVVWALAWLSMAKLRHVRFADQPLWGVLVGLFFLSIGFVRSSFQQERYPVLTDSIHLVQIEDYPVHKGNWLQCRSHLVTSGKGLMLYLRSPGPSSGLLPGSLLRVKGVPDRISNPGNPFEFDYKGFMNRQGIGYNLFLQPSAYQILPQSAGFNWVARSMIFRHWMIQQIFRSGISEEKANLIGSIAFGERSGIDKETIRSFTNTGVIHVLAVSGMNIAMVFVVLQYIFGLLRRYRPGSFIYLSIVLSGIWGYALLTGMSASIMRAAAMATFVLLGSAIKKEAGIMQAWVVSAFCLLIVDPDMLWDVGFQLSYAAVIAIVLWQPPIARWFHFNHWFPEKVWALMAVTLAAQAGTLPLTLHYFHQFPLYFWLANLLIVPVISLILYLSFVVIALYALHPVLAIPFSWLLNLFTTWVIYVVRAVDHLPAAVLRFGSLSDLQILSLTLTFLFLWMFVRLRRAGNLQMAFGCLLIFFGSSLVQRFQLTHKSEMVFFHVPGSRVLTLIQGTHACIVYDDQRLNYARVSHYIDPYLVHEQIHHIDEFWMAGSLEAGEKGLHRIGDQISFQGMHVRMMRRHLSDAKAELSEDDLMIWEPVDVSDPVQQSTSGRLWLKSGSGHQETDTFPFRWLLLDKAVRMKKEHSGGNGTWQNQAENLF